MYATVPSVAFDEDPLSLDELVLTIRKCKVNSAPSPLDQVTYLVFKCCPSLVPALLDLFVECWHSQTVLSSWKSAVIRLIPKAAVAVDSDQPSNFRPIALTSCVGKLFTTIMKNRWLSFMVQYKS